MPPYDTDTAEQTNGLPVTEPFSSESLFPSEQLPLPELCARIYARVAAFLEEETGNESIRSAQVQTRISLEVIGEALSRYRSVTQLYFL
jgi:FAD synthetase